MQGICEEIWDSKGAAGGGLLVYKSKNSIEQVPPETLAIFQLRVEVVRKGGGGSTTASLGIWPSAQYGTPPLYTTTDRKKNIVEEGYAWVFR